MHWCWFLRVLPFHHLRLPARCQRRRDDIARTAGLEGPLIRVQEGCGTECEEEEEYIDEGDRKDDARPPMGLSTVNTNAIAAVLRQVGTTCATEILPEYRIDCIRIHYLAVAAALPDNGDYAPVKAALLDGAAKLDAIVKANLDPVAPLSAPTRAASPPRRRPAAACGQAREAGRG